MSGLTVGTFNLNNLFSRFNFTGVAEEQAASKAPDIEIKSRVDLPPVPPQPAPPAAEAADRAAGFVEPNPSVREYRTYRGKLVQGKDPADTKLVADRLQQMNADVVALQEVEDIVTLRSFLRDYLPAGLYPYSLLIEGRDPRLIDVAVISKKPLGGVTSWQFEPNPSHPERGPIFSRDLLEVEVLDERRRKLVTLYVNHLKSKYLDWRTPPAKQAAEIARSATLRRLQAETVADVLKRRQRPSGKAIVLGDMNDSPGSDALAPFDGSLKDAVGKPVEQGGKPSYGKKPPPDTAWSHRFVAGGKAAYELFDQIWVTSALAGNVKGSWVLRRKQLAGDGSDHDPVWIELEL